MINRRQFMSGVAAAAITPRVGGVRLHMSERLRYLIEGNPTLDAAVDRFMQKIKRDWEHEVMYGEFGRMGGLIDEAQQAADARARYAPLLSNDIGISEGNTPTIAPAQGATDESDEER